MEHHGITGITDVKDFISIGNTDKVFEINGEGHCGPAPQLVLQLAVNVFVPRPMVKLTTHELALVTPEHVMVVGVHVGQEKVTYIRNLNFPQSLLVRYTVDVTSVAVIDNV